LPQGPAQPLHQPAQSGVVISNQIIHAFVYFGPGGGS
jgi:hypothetical protein